jgi:UDP-GlcNAc3NAcA epimerase
VEHPAVSLIDPAGYLEMLYLLDRCDIVLTDSGGLQKEAYFYGKPCVTLRGETEWLELVERGGNLLAPGGRDEIVAAFEAMRRKTVDWDPELYGAGRASRRIAEILDAWS